MTICNRRKFLAFEEDTRPPYTGSWSKRSTKVTGRRPFGKDAALDYEYDSEAEWDEEEGGEDIDGNGMEDDDEEEEREKEKNANYDYGDNWMADDDDLAHGTSLSLTWSRLIITRPPLPGTSILLITRNWRPGGSSTSASTA